MGRKTGDLGQKNREHKNMNLFRNRLWFLMESHSYSREDLAEEIYRLEYVHVGNELYDVDYDRAIARISHRVSSHLNMDDVSKLGAIYVVEYATIFRCTTDYLLGLSSSPTPETAQIASVIGLRPGACERLRNYTDPQRTILDELIFDRNAEKTDKPDRLASLLDTMYYFAMNVQSGETKITIRNELYATAEDVNVHDTTNMLKYRAVKSFEECLDQTSKLTFTRHLNSLAKAMKTINMNRQSDNT